MHSTSRLARLIRLGHVRDRMARADFALATARLLKNQRVGARLRALQTNAGDDGPNTTGAIMGARMEIDRKIAVELVTLASDVKVAAMRQEKAGSAVTKARRALDAAHTLGRDEKRAAAARQDSRMPHVSGERHD